MEIEIVRNAARTVISLISWSMGLYYIVFKKDYFKGAVLIMLASLFLETTNNY